jgi:hypothetical protein
MSLLQIEDWQRTYIAWRAGKGGALDAVASGVRSESMLQLVEDLIESAVRAGFESGVESGRALARGGSER